MTLKKIFHVWYPSAFSFFCLTAENPIIIMMLSTMGGIDAIVAFGMNLMICSLLHTPIIALGPVVAALGGSQFSLKKMFIFSFAAGAIVSLLLATLLITPAMDYLLLQALDLPPEVAAASTQGLWAFVPCPLLVACRRYCQGMLIAVKEARAIALSAWIRIFLSLSLSFLTILILQWPSVFSACLSITIAICSEPILLSFFIRRKIHKLPLMESSTPPFSKILRFYAPIAAATTLSLAYQPIINTFLTHLNEPEVSLAAWTVLFQLLYMSTSFSLELDTVTVSISRSDRGTSSLKIFCILLGCSLALVFFIMHLSPLGRYYFEELNHLEGLSLDAILNVFGYCIPVPILFVMRMWMRGRIIVQGYPHRAQYTTTFGILCLTAFFFVAAHLSDQLGLYIAIPALYFSLMAENSLSLFFIWREEKRAKSSELVI